MKNFKKVFRIILKSILGIVIFVIGYALLSFGLSKIEVNSNLVQNPEIEIFISTNGVHTDIVVPIKNEIKDWTTDIQFTYTKTQDSIMNFGVTKLGLFGSFVRDEAKPDSDVDFLVSFPLDRSIFDLVGLWLDLTDLMGREVDLSTDYGIKEHVKRNALRDAVEL